MSDKITKKRYDDIHSIMVEAASPKQSVSEGYYDQVNYTFSMPGRHVYSFEGERDSGGITYQGPAGPNKSGPPKQIGHYNVSPNGIEITHYPTNTTFTVPHNKFDRGLAAAVHKLHMPEENGVSAAHTVPTRLVKKANEEVELTYEDYDQLDELSKTTLGSYIKKRSHDVATQGAVTRQFAVNAAKEKEAQGGYATRSVRDLEGRTDRAFAKGWKHRQNIGKAVDRLTKEEAELTYEDYAMAILTLGGYDSFGDIDKEDMQDVMEAIDNAYYADDVEVFVRAFSQNNQEE